MTRVAGGEPARSCARSRHDRPGGGGVALLLDGRVTLLRLFPAGASNCIELHWEGVATVNAAADACLRLLCIAFAFAHGFTGQSLACCCVSFQKTEDVVTWHKRVAGVPGCP